MSSDKFKDKLPPDLKDKIGKTFKTKLPDGRIIKYVLGDVTGDGKVDDADIEILRTLCEGGSTAEVLFKNMTPEQLAACDITGNGYINREDLLYLCKSVVDKLPGNKLEDKLASLRKRIKNK